MKSSVWYNVHSHRQPFPGCLSLWLPFWTLFWGNILFCNSSTRKYTGWQVISLWWLCSYALPKQNTMSYRCYNILYSFSPRYTPRLADNIERLGGARYMFLTHMYVLDLNHTHFFPLLFLHVAITIFIYWINGKARLTSYLHTVMMWPITGSGLSGLNVKESFIQEM